MAFALTPGEGLQGIIDYSTESGRKFFKQATVALEPEELFSATSEGLQHFLKLLKIRADDYGWNQHDEGDNWQDHGILWIADDVDDPDCESKNLLDDYGQVELEKVQSYSETFIDQQTRDAQDNRQLFTLIMNSLSKEGKTKVMIWEDKYTVEELPCGL